MKLRVIIRAVAAAGLAAAGYYYPPGRFLALKALGRSPACPLENALAAGRNLQLQIRYKEQILAGSKLLQKDPAGFHLWETPRGRWWIPQGDDFVLPFNLAEQQREIYGSGEHAVRAGDIALDCGANVGVWTRVALDRGARRVVAFEPAPENIESYRRNFKDEIAAGRVVLVPKGAWDKEDILTLRIDPHNSAADTFVMLEKNPKVETVQAPLTTIDKVVAELRLDRVDYIKMDIEGAETRALAGARAALAKYRPRLSVATEHFPADAMRIPEAVRAAWPGYRLTCGPCLETNDGHLRPDVLYFR